MTLCPPPNTAFEGYCGHFSQNYSLYSKDTSEINWKEAGPSLAEFFFLDQLNPSEEPILRFGAIQVPPHLHVTRGRHGFTISGPHYSVLAEVANFINFSLAGTSILEEDVFEVAVKDRFHFAVSDINPVLRIAIQLSDHAFAGELTEKAFGFNLGDLDIPPLGWPTTSLGVLDMDAILQAKKYKSRDPFRFLEAFGWKIWILVFLFGFLISFLMSTKIRSFWPNLKKNFLPNLEYVLFSVFGSPKLVRLKKVPGILAIWTTALWVLQQYFADDMLSAWMEPKPLDVIDSLAQLAETDIIVRVLSTEVFGTRDNRSILETYYKGYGNLKNALIPKSQFFNYVRDYQTSEQLKAFFDEVIERSYRKDQALVVLAWRNANAFCAHQYNTLKRKSWEKDLKSRKGRKGWSWEDAGELYVSESGGDIQPLFFLSTIFAPKIAKEGMNTVITRLTEGGIYQQWIKWATYGRRDFTERQTPVEFLEVRMATFVGPVLIYVSVLLLSFFVLVSENAFNLFFGVKQYMLSKQRKKKRVRIIFVQPISQHNMY